MHNVEDRFNENDVAALLVQFDVTRPEDPAGAAEYCDAFHDWIEAGGANGSIAGPDLERMRADLWFMQGMLCHIQGDLEGALDLLQNSIDHCKSNGYTRRHILALRSIAMCFENAGAQADSTRCIFEALDRANALGDARILALVSLTLTALYQAQGAWTQVLESAMRTCEIAERVDDRDLLSRTYSGVGVALAYVGRADEGFAWLDRAAALVPDGTQPLAEIYLNLNRMFLLRRAGRIDESVALANRQAEVITQISSADAARLGVLIADIYLAAGDLDGAEKMLQSASKAAQSERMTAHLIGFYKTSAKLYEAKGDTHRALEMMRSYVENNREVRGRNAQTRLVALERHFASELADKIEEIHHLRTVELVEKNTQLSDLIHEKDEILHVVVHDLRNPLTAVELLAESLTIDLRDQINEDAASQLESIRSAATEMRNTIGTLLVSHRAESLSDPVPVSTAVRLAVAQAREQSVERDISIEGMITDVDVSVDRALLQRSLDDVLWNAIETTSPGSFVGVAVDPTESGARITITGDVQFDDHFSGGRSLYIARRLIERMNGSIELSVSFEEARHIATIDFRS